MSVSTLADQSILDTTAIRAVFESARQANFDKDPARLVALYAPDADIYDLSPPLAHHGLGFERKAAWFATWEGPIEIESRDLDLTVSGDLATAHGYYHMSGTPRAAGRRISFWMRATIVLRRNDTGWTIVHEHTSVPFYMDGSLRPAFDLNPD